MTKLYKITSTAAVAVSALAVTGIATLLATGGFWA